MTGWQSMATAPRDGTYILAILAPNRGSQLQYHAGRMFVIRHEGMSRGYDMGWAVFPGHGGVSDHSFTHWMPLPPAPDRLQGEDVVV